MVVQSSKGLPSPHTSRLVQKKGGLYSAYKAGAAKVHFCCIDWMMDWDFPQHVSI